MTLPKTEGNNFSTKKVAFHLMKIRSYPINLLSLDENEPNRIHFMARITESYKDHSIVIIEEANQIAELHIDNHVVQYSILKNDHFHTDYIPYQDFESLIDLAKYIIDFLPNVVFESN